MKRSTLNRASIGPLLGIITLLLFGEDLDRLYAQTTNITSSGLNTAINHTDGTSTFFIDGGTRPGGGPNLFHSFGQFSIGEGHTALFRNSDGGATSNIFGRVTGNSVSNIFGTIDTATNFPTANLWLINPNGFLFGPTAALNVGGSVNISSADYLKMADGTRFNALPGPADALLSMAPVEAFGFLERQTIDPSFGRITINGTDTTPSPLAGLSLVGRELVFNGTQLVLSGTETSPNNLLVASVASVGEVRLVPVQGVSGINSQISAGTSLGHITLDNTTISSSSFLGDEFDTTRFFGDELTMGNSTVTSRNSAGSIELNLAGRLLVGEGSQFSIEEQGGLPNIVIRAPVVEVRGGNIDTVGLFEGSKIHIIGDWVTIQDGAISTRALPEGGSGEIQLDLKQGLFLETNGRIFSEGDRHSTGAITINAPVVEMNGGSIRISSPLGSSPITLTGDTVRIVNSEVSNAITPESEPHDALEEGPKPITFNLTGELFLGSGSTISTSSIDSLPGGDISICAAAVHLQGGTINAQASAGTFRIDHLGPGRGGAIRIHAKDGILVAAGSTITSEFTGPGKAGDIVLNAGRDLRIENGLITSAASVDPDLVRNGFVGTAGEIRLTAGNNIQLRNGQITTTSADGPGGNIKLTAPNVISLFDSTISSSVKGQQGSNGGNISIDPVAVAIQNSQILAQANAGAGGLINIAASGVVLVDPNSRLDASAGPAGVSGSVNINAPIQVLGGTLVPLKVSYSQAALSGDRCAADPQGQFSSFVQTGRDGVPPLPGAYAPSPLFVLDQLLSSVRGSQPVNLTAARLGLAGSTHFQFQSGCRS